MCAYLIYMINLSIRLVNKNILCYYKRLDVVNIEHARTNIIYSTIIYVKTSSFFLKICHKSSGVKKTT